MDAEHPGRARESGVRPASSGRLLSARAAGMLGGEGGVGLGISGHEIARGGGYGIAPSDAL